MKYGIALETSLPDALPETFSAVSMPAALLPHGVWPENLAGAELRMVTDPADAGLFRMMPEESFRVRMAFQCKLEQRLCELAALPVHSAVLAPDVDRMAADAGFAENIRSMLRSAAAALNGTSLSLTVSLRLPHPEGADRIPLLFELLQSVPGLRAMAELHPHEPAFAAWDPAVLRPLRMLAPFLQIVYDRNLGNRLTEKLLAPVMGVFAGSPQPPVLMFRPGALEPAALAAEMAELEKLHF